jgi:predicted MFS family arabinose efflux permease
MLMFGAAIGPILGGTLVKDFGYGSVGGAAVVIDGLAIYAFARINRTARPEKPAVVVA